MSRETSYYPFHHLGIVLDFMDRQSWKRKERKRKKEYAASLAKKTMQEEMQKQEENYFADLFDNNTNDIAAELNAADVRHRQEIQDEVSVAAESAAQLMEQISAQSAEIEELKSKIELIEKDVNTRFEQQHLLLSQQKNQIDSIFSRFKNEAIQSKQVLSATAVLKGAVEKRTLVCVYTPDEWHRINAKLSRLQNSTDPAAAQIAMARNLCDEIWQTEETAIKKKLVHDTLYHTVVSQLTAVLETAYEYRTQMIPIPESSQDVVEIETDYWTRGEYTKVVKSLESIKQQMDSSSPDEIMNDELKLLTDKVSECEEHLDTLIETAVRRVLLSQTRASIADNIVDCLYNQAWTLKTENGKESFNYVGGDEDCDRREGVFAIMENKSTGQEITIIVSPNDDETGNTIAFHRNDARVLTIEEYQIEMDSIQREIEKSGFALGERKCADNRINSQDNILADVTQLEGIGAAEKIQFKSN